MKRAILLTLLSVAVALPMLGDDDRHQSYISYDDGGTVIRSGDDGREIEGRRNVPIYPGDEIITARRGRAEVRLSDGNIIGIDRTTALRFRSILDSYEGEANETVAELKYGKVALQRTDLGRDHVRLDTDKASYIAQDEAIYSVETDSRGNDRVTVFDGYVEVRTPQRSTRLRSGESASIDDGGVYDLVGDQRAAADDFERWFLSRAERFDHYSSRYVDRRMGYWADDLDDHGRWVFVTGIGWSWRPFVAVGWRPYYNGYWYHSRYGSMTWVSYDPWGWGTYHYGRWAFDPGFGWVWVPGMGYSPAWVYWMYGSGYVGWAPSGWWDCYRPYYNWAYSPYRDYGISHGFGFYGRVRVNDFDLRPWTFVDSSTIMSGRIDRAALTTDAVKQRLARSRDGYATISGGAARFTREEVRDPAEAIRRRGLDGRVTGRETGAPATDLTPFVRRDAEVGGAIRERIARGRGGSSPNLGGGTLYPAQGATATSPTRGGSVAPIGRGSAAPIGRGSVAPIDRGSSTTPSPAVVEPRRGGESGGRIGRGATPPEPRGGANEGNVRGGTGADTSRGDSWRGRVVGRGSRPATPATPPTTTAPSTTPPPDSSIDRGPRSDSWRGRIRTDDSPRDSAPADRPATRSSGTSDVPRRVIDRIGGARVYPRDSVRGGEDRGSSSRDYGRSRGGDSGSVRSAPSRDSGGSSARSSGDSGGGRSSGNSGNSGNSGSNRGGGGRIKRD